MTKPLYWYLVFNFFRPNIISYLTLLLDACTDLKSILLDFACRKGLPFTKKKSSDIYILWCVWKWEEVRVSLGFSYDALASFWWPCLGWWVDVVSRWIFLDWYCIWWLSSLWFGFSQKEFFSASVNGHPTSFGVLLICLLILFHVSVNMPCCSLLGSEKCNQ